MRRIGVPLLVLAIALAACPALGQHTHPSTQPATAPATQFTGPLPTIALKTSVEEGKKMVVANVQLNGKPLDGAKVSFFVARTFGLLLIGEDDTLDDGTAAVPFLSELPGGPQGKLDVVARIKRPEKFAAAIAQVTMDGGLVVPVEDDPFPRALWAPHAPLGLVLTVASLLCIVWSTYVFVIIQLRRIRKESSREATR